MIDLFPAQAGGRITALLAATESRTLDFKRISAKQKSMIEAVCALRIRKFNRMRPCMASFGRRIAPKASFRADAVPLAEKAFG